MILKWPLQMNELLNNKFLIKCVIVYNWFDYFYLESHFSKVTTVFLRRDCFVSEISRGNSKVSFIEPAFSGPSGMFRRERRHVRGKFPFFSASPCSRFGMPGCAFILQREMDGREFVKWRKRWDLDRVHYLLLLCGQ